MIHMKCTHSSFPLFFKKRAGLKTDHKTLKEYLSIEKYRTVDKTTFNVPGYDFEQSMALFSAIYLATLKRRDDQVSNKKIDNMRTAAFVNAINKIGESYLQLGIFP